MKGIEEEVEVATNKPTTIVKTLPEELRSLHRQSTDTARSQV